MARQRTRFEKSFTARLPDGRRIQIDVFVTEADATTLSDTRDRWVEVSRRMESALGPVNLVGGQLTLARDRTRLERE